MPFTALHCPSVLMWMVEWCNSMGASHREVQGWEKTKISYYTTLPYTTLHYTTMHYTQLNYTIAYYTTLHCTEANKNLLHLFIQHYTVTVNYTEPEQIP